MLFQIAPHSVHPLQSGPSSRSLPSHRHRCYMLCNIRVFSSHNMAIPRKAFLGDIRGDRLVDHRIAPELHFWFGLSLFCPESILAFSSLLCTSFAALLCVAPITRCHISKSVWSQFCTVCSSASLGPSYRRLLQITLSKSSTLFVLCYRHLLHILRLLLLLIPSTWMSWCMVLVLPLSKLLHWILLVSIIRSSFN